nr:hypothetical protein HK105_005893 [Polyrhizophydium stewartii]
MIALGGAVDDSAERMAAVRIGDAAGEGMSLREQLARAIRLHTDIEASSLSSSDPAFQNLVREAVALLVDCKHKAAALALFSDNEILDDVNTADLRFMLAAAYLGDVLLKQSSEDRLAVLTEAEGHLRSFLDLLDQYEMFSKADKEFLKSELGEIRVTPDARRQAKIARFKRERQIKARLQELAALFAANEKSTNGGEDEGDTEREMVLATIDLMVQKSIESLRMIKDEKEMLEMARKHREAQAAAGRGAGASQDRLEQSAPRKKISELTGPLMDQSGKPLRPFVVTSKREELRQGVFRPGHNLPTMTIEEYLEREYERGNFLSGGTQRPEKPVADDNDEAAIDAETLKARQFDDFKDANPRGWGNRHNKG